MKLPNEKIYRKLVGLMDGKILIYPENELTKKLAEKMLESYFEPMSEIWENLNPGLIFKLFEILAQPQVNSTQFIFWLENNLPSLMISVVSYCSLAPQERIQFLPNYDNKTQIISQLLAQENFWGLVHFQKNLQTYSIEMMPWTKLPRNSVIKNIGQNKPHLHAYSGRFSEKYNYHGFVYLQDMVDSAILEVYQEKNFGPQDLDEKIGRILQEFPYPCHQQDEFINLLKGMLLFILITAWVYSVSCLAKDLVRDKESQVSDMLILTGASQNLQRLSWLIFPGIFYWISIVANAYQLNLIFVKTNFTAIFLLLVAFLYATMTSVKNIRPSPKICVT